MLSSVTIACRQQRWNLMKRNRLWSLSSVTTHNNENDVISSKTRYGLMHNNNRSDNAYHYLFQRRWSTHTVESSKPFLQPDIESLSSTTTTATPTTTDENLGNATPAVDFTLESVMDNLNRASKFNQGQGGGNYKKSKKWDVQFVQETVEQYEYCLKFLYFKRQNEVEAGQDPNKEETLLAAPVKYWQNSSNENNTSSSIKDDGGIMETLFLSSETTELAFHAMLRCRTPTFILSQKVREWERCLGSLGKTPLTDSLSLAMLEANGKAGNVGRSMTLLSLRKSRGYPPTQQEFVHAITAIDAAGLYLRSNRNVFLSDKDQPQIDDPTRWLDSILLNMSQRDFPLTTSMANRMLNTYACTGKSGKAVHYFYRVLRSPMEEEAEEDNKDADNASHDNQVVDNKNNGMATFRNRSVKVRLSMRPPPPYHKIPSQVRGKLVRKPGSEVKQLKLDRESDPDWSPPLTSAISFADSLTQGACGHEPIRLDLVSYSILMKACVNRGSLWRAMHILDDVMPANGIEPDVIAFNTLLTGLSRVGDVPTMREYFNKMLSRNISPTKDTVETIVTGLLNLGDVSSAITVVQDCFNQHSILPPYTTHLKILEFALGRGLIYEAKRHVYFIQQLWKWKRNEYHSEQFAKLMDLTKKNPKLSKEALQRLFAYFGEKLDDSDFF